MDKNWTKLRIIPAEVVYSIRTSQSYSYIALNSFLQLNDQCKYINNLASYRNLQEP